MAALAAGAVLTLGACAGSDEASDEGSDAVAATVGDESITVGEVQRSSRELTEVVAAQAQGSGQEPQTIAPETIVTSLIQVPAILDYADREGVNVPSAATIEKQLEPVLPDPSEHTVDFFRANTVYSQFDETAQQEVAETFREQGFDVSPRYASYVDQSPDWLEAAPVEPAMEMP